MIVDILVYLALSALSFGIVVQIHRTVLGTVRSNQERMLFWSVWIAVSVMLAGIYHVAAGDVAFGRMLEVLALALALIIAVCSNIALAVAVTSRKPAAPHASRITQQPRRQLAAPHTSRITHHDDRRLLP